MPRVKSNRVYWEVDDGQLFDILQSRLDDFKKFLDSMAEFLGWQNQKPAEL